MNRLLRRIRQVRPDLHMTGKWILLHDNTLAHSVIRVRQFLAQKMVAVPHHPPYCPVLAPVAFFFFPRLKAAIKVARFAEVNAIKDRVTSVLRSAFTGGL